MAKAKPEPEGATPRRCALTATDDSAPARVSAMQIRNCSSELERMREFVRREMAAAEVTESHRHKLVLAIDEALTCIIADAEQTVPPRAARDAGTHEQHAGPDAERCPESGTIAVTLEIDRIKVRATILDSTNAFDHSADANDLNDADVPNDPHFPNEAHHLADLRETIDQAKPEPCADLGVFLMRSLCDEVEYSYKRGLQNQLVLVRYLL